jgi:hypothetical protein
MTWNRIAVLLNADGTPHAKWPTPVGIEYDYSGHPTRGFMSLYVAWVRMMTAERLLIGFYEKSTYLRGYELYKVTGWDMKTAVPFDNRIDPPAIATTGADLFRSAYPLTEDGLAELPLSLLGDEDSIDSLLGTEAIEREDD